MRAKDTRKKTRCPENGLPAMDIPAAVTADIVGCGVSTVNAVRSGERSADTDLGKTIKIADELLSEGTNLLIKEVKRVDTL